MSEEKTTEALDFAMFIKGRHTPAQTKEIVNLTVPSIKDAHGGLYALGAVVPNRYQKNQWSRVTIHYTWRTGGCRRNTDCHFKIDESETSERGELIF